MHTEDKREVQPNGDKSAWSAPLSATSIARYTPRGLEDRLDSRGWSLLPCRKNRCVREFRKHAPLLARTLIVHNSKVRKTQSNRFPAEKDDFWGTQRGNQRLVRRSTEQQLIENRICNRALQLL